jgi:GNAT superfamily N-acetyltransferase
MAQENVQRGISPVGRVASVRDVPEATACLTSAFHDDPLWGRWTFPDETSRAVRLYELMRSWTSAAARYPWVWMTERAEAVAVWIPPGRPEMTMEEEARFHTLVGELVGERAGDLNDLFERFEDHHPEESHYYLSLWGTHRDHVGRGLGTALLRDNLARIDAERMPAYLESTNPVNLPRYEALGFAPTGEFGPAGGPVITTMWREPRAAARGRAAKGVDPSE